MSTRVLVMALIVATTSTALGGCNGQTPSQPASSDKPTQAQIDAEVAKINQNPAIPPQQKQAAIEEVKRRLGAKD